MKSFLLSSMLTLLLAGCALPLSAPPAPTETPRPTSTPTRVLTATPTLWFSLTLPSTPPVVEGVYQCRVHYQSIKNRSHFAPKERFSVGWKVRNIGSAQWEPGEVVFEYAGGTRMYVSPTANIKVPVAPSEWANPVADMVAPKTSGNHTITWVLRHAGEAFCRMSVTIVVP